jgi:hypothetical protein
MPNRRQTVAMILRPKSPNRSCWFWGPNWKTRPSGFEVKPLTNRRPWFGGSTKKLALIASLGTVQTTHNVTRPLDHPATEYPTCAWSSQVLCTRSSTPTMILVVVCHAAPVTYTPRDKQMWFSTWNKYEGKTIEMSWIRIQASACQWLITIKPRYWPLGFLVMIASNARSWFWTYVGTIFLVWYVSALSLSLPLNMYCIWTFYFLCSRYSNGHKVNHYIKYEYNKIIRNTIFWIYALF